MSWFSSNYDKALLGGGAVVTLGLLYFGWSHTQQSGEDFNKHLMGGGKVTTAVQGAEQIAIASQSMALDHGWKEGEFDGRPVDLFTGIPLFIKRDTGGQTIDLLKDDPVHPPIPNSFWLKYRVDPGFADSPSRDEDGDGYSNLEECKWESDPTDRENHPPLILKLRYVKDDSVDWVIRPGFVGANGATPMRYADSRGFKNNADVANPINPGELFFSNGAAQGRFKFLGHIEKKQMNTAINVMETIILVEIEDQRPNKDKKKYQFPAPLSENKQGPFIQHDRSAVLVLEALGEGGKQLVVEENTHFGLPNDAKKKEYKLLSVTPQAIVVEYPGTNGNPETVEIPQGGMPRLEPLPRP